ncbi:MAG: hypothetical protein GQ570_10250 [Helicobacteraceae bacterium]|nr:hypothetical protein [Helicobacteraceae bacterium]
MRLLLALLLFIASLSFAEEEYSDTPEVKQKVLYTSYENIPKKLFEDQIFTITIKTLSTLEYFDDIHYEFKNYKGLKILSDKAHRVISGQYYFDTFYFLCTSTEFKTPDIITSHIFNNTHKENETMLLGENINVFKLNPNSKFSKIIAKDFTLKEYKTTSYNKEYNIVVFSAEAIGSNIETFNISSAIKQGFESIKPSVQLSTMTYYAIIPSKLEELEFNYFNLDSKEYVDVILPIIVDNDMVSTQSDLKPIDRRFQMIKLSVASGVVLLLLVLIIFRKKFIYIFLIIPPLVYLVYHLKPTEYACVKASSNIYLLPIEQSTIFEAVKIDDSFEVQGKVDGYLKIKLHNNKIGWVKNEDTCSN